MVYICTFSITHKPASLLYTSGCLLTADDAFNPVRNTAHSAPLQWPSHMICVPTEPGLPSDPHPNSPPLFSLYICVQFLAHSRNPPNGYQHKPQYPRLHQRANLTLSLSHRTLSLSLFPPQLPFPSKIPQKLIRMQE